MSQLAIAIKIAVDAHDDQVDKAGQPYILHPLKVMHYTKSEDQEVLATAVLHDAIEDNRKLTYKQLLEAGLSQRVVLGVMALTKVPGEDYDTYKAKVKANADAVIVKMADLRHNSDIRRLKGITEKDIARTTKYHEFYLELLQHKQSSK
jgi:(p)ppGpp synthase/HD superfamily hydrolase